MTIVLFTMNGCGHCVAAKSMLAAEIQDGTVVVKDSSAAPPGVGGFPHFLNTANNKQITGLPPTKKILLESLGYTNGEEGHAAMTGGGPGNTVIVLYSMDGCGFCQRAKALFANEIKEGSMTVKGPQDAPNGVVGFPYFRSKQTGQDMIGLPSSKEELYQNLGLQGGRSEKFKHQKIHDQFLGVI